jgi:two-component system, response regulator PdtaR
MDALAETDPSVILVVEDEFLIRVHAADILEGAGFEVLQAANSVEALEILHERADISLLFTDINLNSPINGVELARVVAERWPDIGLLLTSGALRLGATEVPDDGKFIAKPYHPDTVIGIVGDLIRRHARH